MPTPSPPATTPRRRPRAGAWAALGVGAVLASGLVGLTLWTGSPAEDPAAAADRSATPNAAAAQAPEPTAPLTLDGTTTELRLVGGQTRAFRLAPPPDHHLEIAVEQVGVDVVLRLLDAAGEPVARVDSPTGASGTERVALISDRGASFRLEVTAFGSEEDAGLARLTPSVPRPATRSDRLAVRAERAFAAGEEERRAGEAAEALGRYGEALAAYRELGRRPETALALYRIGWMLHDLGDLEQAAERYREAVELYEDLGRPEETASILNRMGRALRPLGRYEAAAGAYRRALALSRDLGDRAREASALNNLGTVARWSGETEQAMDAFRGALALWEDLDRPLDRTVTRINLGDLYLSQDELGVARRLFGEALGIARELAEPRITAYCLSRLGEAERRAGALEAAREHLVEALALRREAGDPRGEATTLSSLGSVHLEAGEPDAARRRFEQALRLFREHGDRQGEAMALHKLGRHRFVRGDPAGALEHHRAAHPLFEATGDRAGAVATRFGEARALYHLGELQAARAALEEVLGRAETLRAEASSQRLRSSYLSSRRHYWELYVATLMKLHERQPAAGHAAAALEATERWRARSLLESLAEARVKPRRTAPARLLEREERLQRAINGVEDHRLRLLEEGAEQRTLDALLERRDDLLLDLDRVRAEIRAHAGRDGGFTEPVPLSAEGIRERVLDPGTVLLAYFLGDEQSFLWIVSDGGVRAAALPPRSDIAPGARDLYRLLQQRSTRYTRRREELAAALGRTLLAPAAPELTGAGRVLVVPDGELHYLPFAALPDPAADPAADPASPAARRRLVVDGRTVVTLPSASVAADLRRMATTRPPAARRLAVLADPVFQPDDPRVRPGAPAPAPAASGLTRAARDVGLERFDRLPHSAEEAAAVLALVPPESRLGALGVEADRDLVLGGGLRDYRILHFATHGVIDRTHPELSGLVLSLVDERGRPRDGFLRLHEIYGLDLRADLAVLSACRTGLGPEVESEGLIGLPRGFLYAGVPRIIYTLWNIEDRSTAEMMTSFYQHHLGEGLPPADALADAQREMRTTPGREHPYHWAGFVFQGESDGDSTPLDESIEQTDTGGTDMTDPRDDDLPPPPPPIEPDGDEH